MAATALVTMVVTRCDSVVTRVYGFTVTLGTTVLRVSHVEVKVIKIYRFSIISGIALSSIDYSDACGGLADLPR